MDIVKYQEKGWQYSYKLKDGRVYNTNIIILGKTINRMRRNFSPIILICGGQRIGKSFVAVWLSYKILRIFHYEKKFDISRHTFYDPMEAIRNLKVMEREPVIIDEAGSLFNKTEWYRRITRAFDKIIQTQGYKCNCYIFVSPFGSDIAKTFRKHFDFIINVRRKGLLKVKQVPKRYDDMTGKVSFPYILEQIRLPKNAVPKILWEEYEEHSIKKKEELRQKLLLEEGEKDAFGRRIGEPLYV